MLCSYVTLPLYALVSQMGSTMKQSIFDEQTSKALKNWRAGAKKKHPTSSKHEHGGGGGSPPPAAAPPRPTATRRGTLAGDDAGTTRRCRPAAARKARKASTIDFIKIDRRLIHPSPPHEAASNATFNSIDPATYIHTYVRTYVVMYHELCMRTYGV